MEQLSQEMLLAKGLAAEAGKIMLTYSRKINQPAIKSDGTPVTLADSEINHLVIERIKQEFPDDEIVGEEESTSGYGNGRQWICDPIDGTAGFIVGLPTAMFSLAFVNEGIPQIAVAYEPQTQKLYCAEKGQGSYCNGELLQVSDKNFDEGIIALAPDYVTKDRIDLPFVQGLLKRGKRLSIFDGAVMRSCLVANGLLIGFAHPFVKPHDIAAVHLIVEEAGGIVTDTSGNPITYSQNFVGAIVSNRAAHQGFLDLFR